MSEVLTKEKLLEARGLIELGWAYGEPVEYTESSPCYCLGGAIAKVVYGDAYRMYGADAQEIFEQFIGLSGIPVTYMYDTDDVVDPVASVYNFNDENNKEIVLAAIDTAVANIEQN